MSNVINKYKINVDQGYIDSLIDEYINDREQAFLYDKENAGEINKDDSRLVSLAVASMYKGEDIKSLAQKMVVNKNKITYKSSDISGSEELGDTYCFDLNVKVSDLYNVLNALLGVAELKILPFNISVPRPTYLNQGLRKTIQVYSDEEHADSTYMMLDSLANVTKEKCKKPTNIDIKVSDWLGLDIKVDDKYLSDIIRETVITSMEDFSKEDLEDEDKKNIVRERIITSLRDKEIPSLIISDEMSFTDSSIELTVPVPVIEVDNKVVEVTDKMSDEFIQATGTLNPSEVIALMQNEDGMADAAEASIEYKEPIIPDIEEIKNTKTEFDDRATRELSRVVEEVEQTISEAPVEEEDEDLEEQFAAKVIEDLNNDLKDLEEKKEEQLGLTSQITDLTKEIAILFGNLAPEKEELKEEEVPEVNFDEETNDGGVSEEAVGATDEDIEKALETIASDDLANVENSDEVYQSDEPVIPDEYRTSEIHTLEDDLTVEERETLVDSSFVVDEKNQDLIAKYALVSTDPRFFGIQLQLPNGENITVLDYLEDNKVIEKIPLDSVVDTPDGEKITGADFIRRIIPDYVYRYSSLDEIIDTFTVKITPMEQGKVKSKGLLGRFKK